MASSQIQSTALFNMKGKMKTMTSESSKKDPWDPIMLLTGLVEYQDLNFVASGAKEKESNPQIVQPLKPTQRTEKSQKCQVEISFPFPLKSITHY